MELVQYVLDKIIITLP